MRKIRLPYMKVTMRRCLFTYANELILEYCEIFSVHFIRIEWPSLTCIRSVNMNHCPIIKNCPMVHFSLQFFFTKFSINVGIARLGSPYCLMYTSFINFSILCQLRSCWKKMFPYSKWKINLQFLYTISRWTFSPHMNLLIHLYIRGCPLYTKDVSFFRLLLLNPPNRRQISNVKKFKKGKEKGRQDDWMWKYSQTVTLNCFRYTTHKADIRLTHQFFSDVSFRRSLLPCLDLSEFVNPTL